MRSVPPNPTIREVNTDTAAAARPEIVAIEAASSTRGADVGRAPLPLLLPSPSFGVAIGTTLVVKDEPEEPAEEEPSEDGEIFAHYVSIDRPQFMLC